MYLMFIDEAGDPGLVNSPTRYFMLSGLVVHDSQWQPYLEEILKFRKEMKVIYNLKLREEIHSARMINNPGDLVRIKRNDRLSILRNFADLLSKMDGLSIINIVVDKQDRAANTDIFEVAWKALLQRFENTIKHGNFPQKSHPNEKGMIFTDTTDSIKLRKLLRKMRAYNPITSQYSGYLALPLNHIIEDPNFRDSAFSYYIQAADLASFLLYQYFAPNAYMKKIGGKNYFKRLEPILCKKASRTHEYGIVLL